MISTVPPRARRRWVTGLVCLCVVAAGLLSRAFPARTPEFILNNLGDALWAAMVFVILAFVWPRARTVTLFAAAFAIAGAVELSQLYQAPWINTARAHWLGGLVLGHGFLARDLIAYTAGAGAASLCDAAVCGRGSDPDDHLGSVSE